MGINSLFRIYNDKYFRAYQLYIIEKNKKINLLLKLVLFERGLLIMANYPATIIYGGGIVLNQVREHHYAISPSMGGSKLNTYLYDQIFSHSDEVVQRMLGDIESHILRLVSSDAANVYDPSRVTVDIKNRTVTIGNGSTQEAVFKVESIIVSGEARFFVRYLTGDSLVALKSLVLSVKTNDWDGLINEFIKKTTQELTFTHIPEVPTIDPSFVVPDEKNGVKLLSTTPDNDIV